MLCFYNKKSYLDDVLGVGLVIELAAERPTTTTTDTYMSPYKIAQKQIRDQQKQQLMQKQQKAYKGYSSKRHTIRNLSATLDLLSKTAFVVDQVRGVLVCEDPEVVVVV